MLNGGIGLAVNGMKEDTQMNRRQMVSIKENVP